MKKAAKKLFVNMWGIKHWDKPLSKKERIEYYKTLKAQPITK